MTSVKYIGLDVHKESISISVRNSVGKVVMECVIETKASTILQFIDGLRGDLRVVFEEGTWAASLYDLLKPHVSGVEVCNPRKNALLHLALLDLNAYFLYIVWVMSSRDYLGEFEHIVVLALMRLGDRAYGVTVQQEIASRTERDVSFGAIYATLDRLEAKGYVTSRLGEPTAERGGRSKRFFRVTTKGVSAVNRTHRALLSMSEGLNLVGRLSWSRTFFGRPS